MGNVKTHVGGTVSESRGWRGGWERSNSLSPRDTGEASTPSPEGTRAGYQHPDGRPACVGEQAVGPSANGAMVCAAVHGGDSAPFEMRSLTLSPNLCRGQGPITQEHVLFPVARIQPRDMPDLHHEPRSSLVALSRQSPSPEGHGTNSHPQGVRCLPKWFGHSVLYLKYLRTI